MPPDGAGPAQAAAGARLLIVSTAPAYGGAERSMEIILSHLPAGVEAHVLAEYPLHLEALAEIARPGLTVHPVQTQSAEARAKAAFTLLRCFITLRPDAILVNSFDSACVLMTARRVMPEIDRSAFLYVRDFLWPGMGALLASLPHAGILVPHEVVLEREGYMTAKDLAGRRVHVAPDMAVIPAAAPPPPAAGAPLLHLATVNPWKGHVHILEALSEPGSKASPITVRSHGWSGDLALRGRIAQEAAARGLGDRFQLREHVAKPEALIRDSIGVLVSSVSHSGGPETFGRTVIEAWAQARPVIAFKAGAPGRMIRHGIDGLLVPEGDARALAAAMQALHAAPALQAELGAAGYARVRRDFAAPRVVSELLGVLLGRVLAPSS